jgi:glutaredoxin-like protein NrdH
MKKVMKFSRETCVPCKVLANYLAEKNVDVEEYDVENDLELTTKFGVGGVPTLLLVDGDEVLDRVVGFNPPAVDELLEKLN